MQCAVCSVQCSGQCAVCGVIVCSVVGSVQCAMCNVVGSVHCAVLCSFFLIIAVKPPVAGQILLSRCIFTGAHAGSGSLMQVYL